MMHGYSEMMQWGGIGMIVFWIFMVIIIIMLVKFIATSSSDRTATKEPPIDIVKRRYASGEIDKEEYEQKKKDLQ